MYLSVFVCLQFSALSFKMQQNGEEKKKKKKHPVDKILACLFLGVLHVYGRAGPRTALRLSGLPRPVPSSPGNM